MSDKISYLFAAYSVVWVALFIYLLTLSRRTRQLKREIQTLKEQKSE